MAWRLLEALLCLPSYLAGLCVGVLAVLLYPQLFPASLLGLGIGLSYLARGRGWRAPLASLLAGYLSSVAYILGLIVFQQEWLLGPPFRQALELLWRLWGFIYG